ncbi:hypothetical protein ACFV4N_29630 [Actinosynnema sp. NPDC059797]
MSRGRRRSSALVLAVAALVLPAAPAAATPDLPAASAAARWLAGQLSADGTLENPLGSPFPDHGLMIDVLFAAYATGQGHLAEPIVSHLDDQGHASDYFTWDGYAPGQGFDAIIVGGAAAKVLVAAQVTGRDPRNFDGYDMVAETKAAIMRSGPDKGRISDYSKNPDFADSVGNNANTFGQALGVIGLAVAGENDQLALDRLLTQQCRDGYFRIFYEYVPAAPGETGEHVNPAGYKLSTCDEGVPYDKAPPDRDSTGIALSALLAARRSGVQGLDWPIDKAVAWLKKEQTTGGGWGGGVGTEAPNTNSTGLVVQALAEAGGAGAHVARGVAYLKSAQVTEADAGTALADEVGAIGYDPEHYEGGKVNGLGPIDTWVRAGAQAAMGLAQVGFYELARGQVPQEGPPSGTATTTPTTTAPPAPAASAVTAARQAGNPAPPPGPRRGAVLGPAPAAQPGGSTPAARLGAYLAGGLVGGDHVEVTQGGTTFVDYDATADVVLALRALGGQPEAVERATRFLLRPESIDAYAHGVPYEEDEAAYAEPLAKLLLVARFDQGEDDAPADLAATVDRLSADLVALRGEDGRFTDTGSFADTDESVRRHAWAVAATVAVGDDTGESVDLLVDARCADGSFPVDLVTGDCETGDLAATAAAVTALNLRGHDGGETGHTAPEGWSPERTAALVDGARALGARTAPDGLVVNGDAGADVALSSAVAAGRRAAGLDADTTARSLGTLLLDDGGLPGPDGAADFTTSTAAAPGLAGRSWVDAEGSPVAAVVRLPLAERESHPAAHPEAQPVASTSVQAWSITALGGVALALVIGFVLGRSTTRRKNRRKNQQGVAP